MFTARLLSMTWIALIALGCLACGSTSTFISTGSGSPTGRKRPAEDVDIYTATRPTRPFREAGMIESRQASGWSLDGADDVVKELRREAGERGCDGVILTGSADEVVGGTTVAANGGTTSSVATLKGYRATCVVYTLPRQQRAPQHAEPDTGVLRGWNHGHVQLNLKLGNERVSMTLIALPGVDAEHAHVTLQLKHKVKSSTDRDVPSHAACEIETVADGQSSTATDRKHEGTPSQETIEANLEIAALKAALAATSASFRLCDTEIALSESTRKRLSAFINVFDEELTKLADRTDAETRARKPEAEPPEHDDALSL